MIVTVFRSKPSTDLKLQDEYRRLAPELNDAVQLIPGYISHKRFVADDGERCTIVEFEDEAAQRQWANNPTHQQAMDFGKTKFFTEYDIKVCELKYQLSKP